MFDKFQISVLIYSLFLRQTGILVSYCLPMFWFTSLLISLMRFYNQSYNSFQFNAFDTYSFILYVIISLIQLILSNISDTKLSSKIYQKKSDLAHQCPFDDKPLINRITFYWIFKILLIGLRRRIEIVNLLKICSYLKSSINCDKFESNIKKKQLKNKGKKLTIGTVIWSHIYTSYLCGAFFELLQIASSFLSPFLLRLLLI